MNALEDIWDGNYVYPDINARYDRLKTRDRIKKAQSEQEGEELSQKMMGKGLHKVFKYVLNKVNNSLPTLGEQV